MHTGRTSTANRRVVKTKLHKQWYKHKRTFENEGWESWRTGPQHRCKNINELPEDTKTFFSGLGKKIQQTLLISDTENSRLQHCRITVLTINPKTAFQFLIRISFSAVLLNYQGQFPACTFISTVPLTLWRLTQIRRCISQTNDKLFGDKMATKYSVKQTACSVYNVLRISTNINCSATQIRY